MRLLTERLEDRTLLAGEPIIDFHALPERITSNISTFLIAGSHEPDDVVQFNGTPIPATAISDSGAFAFTAPLARGNNTLELVVRSANGDETVTSKTIKYDPTFRTDSQRLLYVDIVTGRSSAPEIEGTAVVDVDNDTVLGFLEDYHVRGISPAGHEIYMHNREVVNTASHQVSRTLPFTTDIATNSFIAATDYLYSGTEVVDLHTNTLAEPLPVDITTGNTYSSSASIPGGPAINPAETMICAQRRVKCIDLSTRAVIDTDILAGPFTSDLALKSDRLFVSTYGGSRSGRVKVYDTNTFELIATTQAIGDFAGEIGFLNDNQFVFGNSGNPRFGGGGVALFDIEPFRYEQFVPNVLADNLTTSTNEVFVSSGAVDDDGGKRFGIDVLELENGESLVREKTFFLGVNPGSPRSDQIRRIVLKPQLPDVQIVDDGDAGYSAVGRWDTYVQGFQGDVQRAFGCHDPAFATWKFPVAPGRYQVAATWTAWPSRATTAPYEILDGAHPIARTYVNQQVAPDDFVEDDTPWDVLGTFDVFGPSLVVTLDNAAHGSVIADGIRIERVGDVVSDHIVDDGDAGYSTSGSWRRFAGQGFQDDLQRAFPGDGSAVASWTIPVSPGRYQLATTWTGWPTRATDAPYTIFDGTRQVGQHAINQQLVPDDFVERGAAWEILGTFDVFGTSLVVNLDNAADGVVIADAISIERVGELNHVIVDNGDPGYGTSGNWRSFDQGFQGDLDRAFSGDGSAIASWTVPVSPGRYRVVATWNAWPTRATDAPYTILDGALAVGQRRINQQAAPDDFADGGATWETLGTYDIVGTSLVVNLSNDADGVVIADALRIERVDDVFGRWQFEPECLA